MEHPDAGIVGNPVHGFHLRQGQRRCALRRTHATLLQHAGATLREAQAQLGHTKMSTTLEIYTVSIPQAQRRAVENLSRMVTNGDELVKVGEKLPMLTQQIQ